VCVGWSDFERHVRNILRGGVPRWPRYDGKIQILELTGSPCATLSEAVGDEHKAVFRAKVSESGLAEAMSIVVPRGMLFVSAELDETFAGKKQVATGSFIIDAFRSSLPDAVLNLKFEPPVVNPDTVGNFKFKGSWQNYRVFGCTARVKGIFRKRSASSSLS
jgi:hypothetical protein